MCQADWKIKAIPKHSRQEEILQKYDRGIHIAIASS